MELITKSFVGDDEKKIVEDFHNFIKKEGFDGGVLSGYNIRSFDDPLIQSRFIKYNLPEIKVFGNRYDSLDIRDMLDGSPNAKGTLDDYLKFFNIGQKYNGYNGASVQGLYQDKNWEHITKYVEEDSRLEALLLERVLKYKKTKHNIFKILVYDIEVILPEKAVEIKKVKTLEEWESENLEKLRSKYAKEETVQKHFSKMSYQDEIDKHQEETDKEIKKGIFDKFKNKIVAIGVSYWKEEDLF